MKLKKVFLTVGLAGIGLFISLAAIWYVVFPPLSENRVIYEVLSPNQQHKAVVFERNSGMTTGPNTHISLLRSDEKLPNKGGNVFIGDRNYGRAPSANWGGPDVKISWLGLTELEIKHHSKARIFKSETQIRGINVRYRLSEQ